MDGQDPYRELSEEEITDVLTASLRQVSAERVLVLIPDNTRTAPIGMMVKTIHRILRDMNSRMDILVALGTHQPMSREALLDHLDMSEELYASTYSDVALFNHTWDDPSSLVDIGEVPSDLITGITEGLMSQSVRIMVNRRLLEYDRVVIVGPVFPHEVVGFSGGSKYLFPGVSGAEITNFFHWLGAVITNLKVIGRIDNPVRRVLDEASKLVPVPVLTVSIVVHRGGLVGLYAGESAGSWRSAAEHSARVHVVHKSRTFDRVLACSPLMYEDIWTGAKCMYKCEPVVADGGELIIYGPHIESLSLTHGHILEEIGFHVRDYYLKQPERFAHIPGAVKGVSTYVRGSGTYEDGIERARIRVTLATGIPRDLCERVGLGYLDPDKLKLDDWRDREEEGILFVERAGETLFLPDRGVPNSE